ncbi:formyltransferase family protein [Deltaproteobacteria bacterium TL4]
MNNIILIGSSTPVQKLLHAVAKMEHLNLQALYTDSPHSREIQNQAQLMGLEFRDINLLKTEVGIEILKEHAPDWLFSVNSTFIFPASLLAIPLYGALNMHPGKLPEYAGLHTHQWAIRNGEKTFAATLHWMDAKVDAGPIAYLKEFPVSPKDTGLSLFIKCLNAGTELVVKALSEIAQGQSPPQIQQDLSLRKIYYHREALDGTIPWEASAQQILDFIRAADYSPFQSPTYTPMTRFRDLKLSLQKAKSSTLPSQTPGMVLSVNASGVTVATGQKESLLITKIVVDPQETLSGPQIAERLNIQTGERFY